MRHRRALLTLAMVGLIATGIGFLGASINPGQGPRTMHGSLSVAGFYLPPLLVGVVTLVIAGLVGTRIRWMPMVGAVLAVILLIGSATLGSDAVTYRLTHPGAGIGFVEDWLQILGEVLAAVAGFAAMVLLIRGRIQDATRRSPDR